MDIFSLINTMIDVFVYQDKYSAYASAENDKFIGHAVHKNRHKAIRMAIDDLYRQIEKDGEI